MSDKEKTGTVEELESLLSDAKDKEIIEKISLYGALGILFAYTLTESDERDTLENKEVRQEWLNNTFLKIDYLAASLSDEGFAQLKAVTGFPGSKDPSDPDPTLN